MELGDTYIATDFPEQYNLVRDTVFSSIAQTYGVLSPEYTLDIELDALDELIVKLEVYGEECLVPYQSGVLDALTDAIDVFIEESSQSRVSHAQQLFFAQQPWHSDDYILASIGAEVLDKTYVEMGRYVAGDNRAHYFFIGLLYHGTSAWNTMALDEESALGCEYDGSFESVSTLHWLLDDVLIAAGRREARTWFRSLYGPLFYVPQLKLRLKNHLRAVARARLAFRDLGNRSRRRLAAIVIQRAFLEHFWSPKGDGLVKLKRKWGARCETLAKRRRI